MQQTWVGEYWWSDSRKENGTATTANGIVVIGNDHVISDIVVFSSKAGIVVEGAFGGPACCMLPLLLSPPLPHPGEADLISNVHTWNLATANGGSGIIVNASQTRISGWVHCHECVIHSPVIIGRRLIAPITVHI